MDRNIPYGDKACVFKMSRKQSKSGSSEIFYKSDLILGSIPNSMVVDTALDQLISAINVKEAAPSCIHNGQGKDGTEKGSIQKGGNKLEAFCGDTGALSMDTKYWIG